MKIATAHDRDRWLEFVKSRPLPLDVECNSTKESQKGKVTAERLRSLFHYCDDTGVFTRIASIPRGGQAGSVAGGKTGAGYVALYIDGRRYWAHRLVWLYMHGRWPKEIDHINGVRDDNRIANLREVSRRKNGQNRVEHRSGRLVGCYYLRARKKWVAQIRVSGINKYLGIFPTEREAHEAYESALAEVPHD
jgi:hypothetical protein